MALSVLTQIQSYKQPGLNGGYQLSRWAGGICEVPEKR